MKKKTKSTRKVQAGPKINLPLAIQLREGFLKKGYSAWQTEMFMSQIFQETGGLKSKRAIENFNFGGVKYKKSFGPEIVPSTDYFAPAKEDKGKRVPYAKFPDVETFIDKWAHYDHVDSMVYDNKEGKPLDANNLEQYAHRLKLNRYYQDSESNYIRGLKYWDSVIKKELLPTTALQTDVGFSPEILGYKSRNVLTKSAEDATPLSIPDITPPQPANTVSMSNISELPGGNMQINTMGSQPSMTITVTAPVLVPKDAIKNGVIDLRKVPLGKTSQYTFPINELPKNKEEIKSPEIDKKRNFLEQPKLKSEWNQSEWNDYFKSMNSIYQIPFTSPGSFGAATNIINSGTPFDIPGISKAGEMAEKNALSANMLKLPNYSAVTDSLSSGSENNSTWRLSNFPDTVNGYEEGNAPQGNNANNSIVNNSTDRTVNIHLNTPLIGNFTISTKEAAAGLSNLRQQVEGVLLDVLNSANAIA